MNFQTTGDKSAAPDAAIGMAAASGTTGDHSQSRLAREYHDFLGDDLVEAKARVTTYITSARASVAEAGNVVLENARAGAKATDRYVRAQPWQAVGISAVAGALIGFLFGRRGT